MCIRDRYLNIYSPSMSDAEYVTGKIESLHRNKTFTRFLSHTSDMNIRYHIWHKFELTACLKQNAFLNIILDKREHQPLSYFLFLTLLLSREFFCARQLVFLFNILDILRSTAIVFEYKLYKTIVFIRKEYPLFDEAANFLQFVKS